MRNTRQNEKLTKLGTWVKENINKYEGIVAFILVFSFLFDSTVEYDLSILTILSLIVLSVSYYFLGFASQNNASINEFEKFVLKTSAMGCSILVLGILFFIQNYPGYSIMLTIGNLTLIVSFLGIIVLNKIRKGFDPMPKRLLIRISIIFIVGISLKIISPETLSKFGLDQPSSTSQNEQLQTPVQPEQDVE